MRRDEGGDRQRRAEHHQQQRRGQWQLRQGCSGRGPPVEFDEIWSCDLYIISYLISTHFWTTGWWVWTVKTSSSSSGRMVEHLPIYVQTPSPFSLKTIPYPYHVWKEWYIWAVLSLFLNGKMIGIAIHSVTYHFSHKQEKNNRISLQIIVILL